MEIDIDFQNEIAFNNFSSNTFYRTKNNKPDIDNELLLTKEKSDLSYTSSTTNNYENTSSVLDNRKNYAKFTYKKVGGEKKQAISSVEARLIKDMEELKKNKEIGKYCEVKINEYKQRKETNEYELIIEYKNYFSVIFIFGHDYPFSPPKIFYHSGLKLPYIFDEHGNVLLENTKNSKWTPALFVSHFVISIEILISKGLNKNEDNSNTKYGKRKWNDYLKEEKKIFINDVSIIKILDNNLKKIHN